MGLLLTVGGAVIALAWGVWLGLPGRWSQSVDDIEKSMEQGGGSRRTARRVFTPLAWLMRNTTVTTPRRDRRFRLDPPKDR